MFDQPATRPITGPFKAFALWGGIAGAIAWAVTEPFASTANHSGALLETELFTYGSLFGWLLTSVLGALIGGALTFVVSAQRTTQNRALLAAIFATVLGGGLMCAVDNGLDIFFIHALKTSHHLRAIHFIEFPAYGVLDSLAVALAVGICAQPTPARFARAMLAGLIGGVAVFLARRALGPLSAIFALMHGVKNLQVWYPFDPSRLAEHIALGVVMGLVLALSDQVLGRATLRLQMGRNEGKDFVLFSGSNRIGSMPGVEVTIFGDSGVAPVHAVVAYQQGVFALHKVAEQPVFVNGTPIVAARLNLGDTIQVGTSILVFTAKGGGNQVAGYHSPVAVAEAETATRTPSQVGKCVLVDLIGGAEIPLKERVFSIGRDPSNSLCLSSDSRVSRRHAELISDNSQVIIRDLQSTNGTLVNGVRVGGETTLSDGDQIEIGTSKFVLRQKG